MKLVNLTPHVINLRKEDGSMVDIAPSGQVARVDAVIVEVARVDDVIIRVATYGDVQGLPDPQEGVGYLVSGMVLSRVSGRADVFAPGNALRDDAGRVIGCDGLSATEAWLE